MQRGLNPRKTLVGFGGLRRGKRLAAEKRDEKERWEERDTVRSVFAVTTPMAILPVGVDFIYLFIYFSCVEM